MISQLECYVPIIHIYTDSYGVDGNRFWDTADVCLSLDTWFKMKITKFRQEPKSWESFFLKSLF